MLGRMMKVGVVQMLVGKDKTANINRATKLVTEASQNGAKLVILPECFNSPYGTNFFQDYSEAIPGGETFRSLSKLARECKVYLVGGTMPEAEGNNLYNTCTVYTPTGELLTKYRKMHLFDIDIPGKITFKESETLSAGNSFSTFKCGGFQVGLGICYDLRFPEFSSILTQQGCNMLIFPSAFNTTTGPLHWHLLQRTRAVDQASYLISASPARNLDGSYHAYGHSLVVAPDGAILGEAGEGEEIIYAEVDMAKVEEMRKNIPALKQKRTDLYNMARLI